MKEAAFYEKRPDGTVQCHLCPHQCVIAEGRHGRCRVRTNRGGTLYSDIYGLITSAAMDPIEKKPLYHFHPGSSILSLGTRGCNFACEFCQNWSISQADAGTSPLPSKAAVQAAQREASIGIAYTYNEPLIWFEYVFETAKLAREAGLVNVLVSNGYVSPEPLEELLPYVDAMNLDIKAIRPDFYKRLCHGTLEPVLATARTAARRTHLEVTNLVIPGHNDTDEEFEELGRWIAGELGPHIPTHLSAYFPRYKLKAPPTPVETLERAHEILSRRLRYVYLGNCQSDRGAATRCHGCGAVLITRKGYRAQAVGLRGSACAACGEENYIVP